MNFEVTRKNNLNIPMFTIDGRFEKEFCIQTIKKIALQLYEMKYNNEPINYTVTCKDASLEEARKRLENCIRNILEDKESYLLFLDTKKGK